MAKVGTEISDKFPSPLRIVLTVLLPFGLGYYLSYLYRTVNVVIARPLTADLSLSASDLGLLTSIYFIVFASFQTPLGVLLDRYGPRRIQVVLLLIAAAGGALFALSTTFLVLSVARGLIGLGVSGCLMAAIKANVLWFPRERLPLVNGCTIAFGTFGALSATVPVEFLFDALGWRPIFLILAAATVVVAVMVHFLVPEKQLASVEAGPGATGVRGLFHELGSIYASAYFWRVGVIAFLHNAVFLSYQSLWMGPWLRDVAGMNPSSVAETMLWFNVGMFFGVLIIGMVADKAQSIGVRPVAVMGGGIGISILIQCFFALELTDLATPLSFAFGFFGSSPLLVFSVLAQSFPSRLVGRVNTAQNMLSFIGAFAAQWGIGAIIGFWPEVSEGIYNPAGHRAAFVMAIGIELLAFLWFVMPRRSATGIER